MNTFPPLQRYINFNIFYSCLAFHGMINCFNELPIIWIIFLFFFLQHLSFVPFSIAFTKKTPKKKNEITKSSSNAGRSPFSNNI